MRVLLVTAVMVVALVSCAMVQRNAAPVATQAPDAATAPAAPWETVVRGAYENRGVAQVERLGARWVLNVMCDGTHTTYIDDSPIDLTVHTKGYVSARYQYVERTIADPRCVRAPCAPVRERRIALERVTSVTATPDEARQMARDCQSSAGK